jgi:hypothetical protein
MRSILVSIADQILRVSQILRGIGTLTHYRDLRDDGRRGHRGRGSTYDPSAPRSLDGPRGPRTPDWTRDPSEKRATHPEEPSWINPPTVRPVPHAVS